MTWQLCTQMTMLTTRGSGLPQKPCHILSSEATTWGADVRGPQGARTSADRGPRAARTSADRGRAQKSSMADCG